MDIAFEDKLFYLSQFITSQKYQFLLNIVLFPYFKKTTIVRYKAYISLLFFHN